MRSEFFLQLGISGAVLLVVYRIAVVVLRNWRESEKERNATYAKAEDDRTKALAAGFSALVGRIETHHTADLESHRALGEAVAEIRGELTGARWYREEFTPVGPPPQPPPKRTATPGTGIRVPRPGTHHDKDR